MKKKILLIVFTALSLAILIVGFLHIPIMVWSGVDVFALRGLLIFTCLPTVGVSAVPLAICTAVWLSKWKNKK